MMEKLSQLSKQSPYPYGIIKDLYEFFDIKKDGIVDITEWLQSFKRISESDATQGQMQKQRQQSQTLQIQVLPQFKQSRTRNIFNGGKKKFLNEIQEQLGWQKRDQLHQSTGSIQGLLSLTLSPQPEEKEMEKLAVWELSSTYDQVKQIIGKNRKYLLKAFEEAQKSGEERGLKREVVKDVLRKLLKRNGIIMEESLWQRILSFAEKEGLVDFKFMLEVFKDQRKQITQYPKFNFK